MILFTERYFFFLSPYSGTCMNFFSSRPSSPNPLRLSLTSLGKLSLLAGALFAAGTLSASEDRFATVADLERWFVAGSKSVYSGSAEGSHSGNSFTFSLSKGNELAGLDFYGASDAAVENGNSLIFSQGRYLASKSETFFHSAHKAAEEANGNAIVIEGGNFALEPFDTTPSEKFVFIAAEGTGNMSGNRVRVTGGDFSVQVMLFAAKNEVGEGDVTDTGPTLTDNTIEITGGNFEADADVEVASAEVGTLSRNRLEIKRLQNGRINMAYAAYTMRGDALDNEIVIEDAENLYVQSDFFTATAGSPAPSTLAKNLLTITNSTIDSPSFGAAMNASGDVVENRVEITNTTLTKSSDGNVFVYGGLHQGQGGLDGRITGNVIRLKDVTLDLEDNQTVFFIASQLSASEGCELTDNAVEIVGDGNWDKRLSKARFVGAQRFGGTEQNDIHDNALRLYGWRGEVSSIKGFDRIELNAVPWEANGTVLRVDMTPYETWDGTVTDETLDLSGTTFTFVDGGFVFERGADAHLGESMTLIEAGNHTDLTLNPLYDGEGQAIALTTGITTEVEGRIVNAEDGKSIVLELEDAPVANRQLALVTNHRNMAVTFLGQAAEIVGDTLTEPPKDYRLGPKTFAVMNGADVKYESSGKLTVRGMNFLAGAGTSVETDSGIARVNFFAETGRGEFDDSMRLSGLTRRLDGTMTYYGVGTSARHLLENGFYAEGSLRVGRYENDVDHGLVGADGLSHGYKTRSLYAAAHAGLGRIFPVTADLKLEVFGKYFFTYLPSDTARVKDSDGTTTLRFESVDNHRVRTGARLYAPAGDWQGYLGAAFEYDFTETLRNEANGVEIRGGESIRGATGIGEAGLRHAKAGSPWLFDVRLRGYCGKREGASLKLQAEYGF